MNIPLLNLLRTSKVFAVVLGLHLFILSLLLFHPGCQKTQPTPAAAPMGEVTALDNATLAEPTRPTDTLGTSTTTTSINDTMAATTPIIDSSVAASAPVEAPVGTTYTVAKGDSLWSIARKNSVTVNALLEANGFNRNTVIKPGQEIQIPSAPTAAAPAADVAAPVSTESASYKVKSGDTLAKIAKKNGVSVRALKSANHLSSDVIRVGQKLTIPGTASKMETSPATTESAPAVTASTEVAAPAAATSEISSADYATHKVAKGESPAVIAKKYGMKTSELLSLNNITDPRKLKIGQELKVKASAATVSTETVATTTTTAPSVEALDAMTTDKAEEAAPAIEVKPATTLK